MTVNGEGWVESPDEPSRTCDSSPGEEVDAVADEVGRPIVDREPGSSGSVVERLRGRSRTDRSTDELMALLRGD